MELLDTLQFCYNLHKLSTTKKSPFELVLGIQPNMLFEVSKSKIVGKCPASYRPAQDKKYLLDEA